MAEEPEIKLPTSIGSSRKQGNSRNDIHFCFLDYTKAFDCVDHNKLWKILKHMGIPDHLTCLLQNLYAGQEATVRTRHIKMDWFKTGKGVRQSCILSRYLFNLYAEFNMWNSRLDESQMEKKWLGEISTTSGIQMIRDRKRTGTKELLDGSERQEWKADLKLNIQKLRSWHLVPSLLGK